MATQTFSTTNSISTTTGITSTTLTPRGLDAPEASLAQPAGVAAVADVERTPTRRQLGWLLLSAASGVAAASAVAGWMVQNIHVL